MHHPGKMGHKKKQISTGFTSHPAALFRLWNEMCTFITQRGMHLFILNQTQVFYPLSLDITPIPRHIPAVVSWLKVPNVIYIWTLTCKISGLSLFFLNKNLVNKASNHTPLMSPPLMRTFPRLSSSPSFPPSLFLSLSLSGVTCSLTSGRLSLNSTNVTFNEAVGWNYRSVTHIRAHLHRKHSRQTPRLKTVSLVSVIVVVTVSDTIWHC